MIRSANVSLEDQLGPNEPPYRSRGEAQVGRLLDRYNLPFFYEQPTIIYDRGRHKVWRPDFTVPSLNSLVIEYAGMPDVPDYMAGIRHKQSVYRANEIPALFVHPEQLKGPRWPERVIEQVYRAGRSAASYGLNTMDVGSSLLDVPVSGRYLPSMLPFM